jgi:hypothetical protein
MGRLRFPRPAGYANAGLARKSLTASHRRDGLDLDQEIRTIQFRHLDQRHRGRRRRRDRSKEPVSRLAIGSQMVHIGEEHRQLHQMGCRASASPKRNSEVAKHLRRLGGEIGLADHIAIGIERGLA